MKFCFLLQILRRCRHWKRYQPFELLLNCFCRRIFENGIWDKCAYNSTIAIDPWTHLCAVWFGSGFCRTTKSAFVRGTFEMVSVSVLSLRQCLTADSLQRLSAFSAVSQRRRTKGMHCMGLWYFLIGLNPIFPGDGQKRDLNRTSRLKGLGWLIVTYQ